MDGFILESKWFLIIRSQVVFLCGIVQSLKNCAKLYCIIEIIKLNQIGCAKNPSVKTSTNNGFLSNLYQISPTDMQCLQWLPVKENVCMQ